MGLNTVDSMPTKFEWIQMHTPAHLKKIRGYQCWDCLYVRDLMPFRLCDKCLAWATKLYEKYKEPHNTYPNIG